MYFGLVVSVVWKYVSVLLSCFFMMVILFLMMGFFCWNEGIVVVCVR